MILQLLFSQKLLLISDDVTVKNIHFSVEMCYGHYDFIIENILLVFHWKNNIFIFVY